MRSSIFWVVVQHSMMVRYWRCRTRHWSCLQRLSFTAWPLKVGQVCCPKTSVTNYQPMPINITEEQRPRVHCGASYWFYYLCEILAVCQDDCTHILLMPPPLFLCLHTQLKAMGYIKEANIEVGKTRYKWGNVHIFHLLFKRLCFGDKWFLCLCFLILFLNKLLYKTA